MSRELPAARRCGAFLLAAGLWFAAPSLAAGEKGPGEARDRAPAWRLPTPSFPAAPTRELALARLADLTRRIAALPDDPHRRDLMLEAAELKQQVWLETPSLRTRAAGPIAPEDRAAEAAVGLDDLDATSVPPGWTAPVVPRETGDATPTFAPLSPTLSGNWNTYVNFSTLQTGPDPLSGWAINVYLDDEFLTRFDAAGSTTSGQYYGRVNEGPHPVRGGRHTLRSVADPDHVIAETNEGNNSFEQQWVWSPFITSWGVPNVRPQPPTLGTGACFNSDGFQFTRNPSYAWVVGVAGLAAGDDDDLFVYDDYSGSTAGFTHYVGGFNASGNSTEFVVGHYAGTPTTLYPAVCRDISGSDPGGPFSIDPIDARLRNGPAGSGTGGDATWPDQVLGSHRLADVYEAYMAAGSTWYLSLRRKSGNADLLFTVYPGTTGGVYSRLNGLASSPLGPEFDVLAYTASEAGWHPIVVYRENGTGADQPVTYDFAWSSSGLVAVPGEEARKTALAFLGARPNPVPGSARFEFALPEAGRARLALFDVSGRAVRTVADRVFGAGPQTIAWDGRGEGGASLSPGVYWARLEAAGQCLTRRLALLP